MTATLPIPFAIGEEVWAIGNGHREEWIECPECAGTKRLTLIKGNGEEVALWCDYCALGCDPPRGVVKCTIYECQPEKFVCRRVVSLGSADGIGYTEAGQEATSYTYRYSNDLFRNREECLAKCRERNEERKKHDAEREIANLASKRRSLSHSSHYWTSQLRKLERDIEIAKQRIAVIKERKKEASL